MRVEAQKPGQGEMNPHAVQPSACCTFFFSHQFLISFHVLCFAEVIGVQFWNPARDPLVPMEGK